MDFCVQVLENGIDCIGYYLLVIVIHLIIKLQVLYALQIIDYRLYIYIIYINYNVNKIDIKKNINIKNN